MSYVAQRRASPAELTDMHKDEGAIGPRRNVFGDILAFLKLKKRKSEVSKMVKETTAVTLEPLSVQMKHSLSSLQQNSNEEFEMKRAQTHRRFSINLEAIGEDNRDVLDSIIYQVKLAGHP